MDDGRAKKKEKTYKVETWKKQRLTGSVTKAVTTKVREDNPQRYHAGQKTSPSEEAKTY